MKIKNISLILFSLLILFSISGCSLKGNKINMNRIYGLDRSIEIDTTKRQELINNQRNFVLLIYNSECSSCETILNEVDSLVKDESIEIYTLDITSSSLSLVSPSLEIYKDGIKVKAVTKEATLYNKNKIYQEISRFFSYTKEFSIDTDDLDEIIQKENALILFKLGGCSDCVSMYNYFLNDLLYNYRYKSMILYSIEINVSNIDFDLQDFKDKYGLSTKNNSLGYLNGRFPSFILYNKGEIIDECVVYNDEFSINNEDNITYTLVSSYYKDNKYIGKTYKSLDDYHRATKGFYKDKVESILKKIIN